MLSRYDVLNIALGSSVSNISSVLGSDWHLSINHFLQVRIMNIPKSWCWDGRRLITSWEGGCAVEVDGMENEGECGGYVVEGDGVWDDR